ncbi:hypothetical protein PG997_005722 [Apiospora hydei]|uniref:Uncharacterized protein n=1 Tax=Apiospora hydei TaxID=1337664 RepID=A0ABR1WLR7_9PEZI
MARQTKKSEYVPVQRSVGLTQSKPNTQTSGYTPMERWIAEEPTESPYHALKAVRMNSNASTAQSQAAQQGKARSDQATTGSR